MSEREAAILEVADWLEEPDLRDLAGICARRKRDREDARLRGDTAKATRADLARMVRARVGNKVGDPAEFLRDVRAGQYSKAYTSFDIREAISLADKGLMVVEVATQIAGPWNNMVGGNTRYLFSLTDRGRALIAQPE